MTRVTIFSSSNRSDNKTKVFADLCCKLLEDQGVNARVCSLEQFPSKVLGPAMYDYENSPVLEIVEKYLTSVDKLIFVLPEYNGSFPGILKLFIDSVEPKHFKGKKAALIGISSGRSGNVRGMDHLTNILNYIKVDVFHHKLPIASIDGMISNGNVSNEQVIGRMRNLIEAFDKF